MKKEDFIYASSICCSTWINGFKKPQSLHVARILIVKLDEIGDMVNAVPVFQELKKSILPLPKLYGVSHL
jgi:hypothetical protein